MTLQLGDIPFEETRPQEPPAPPFTDLWSRDAQTRYRARLHWLIHPRDGLPSVVTHELMRPLPCDAVSSVGGALAVLSQWRYRHRIFANRIKDNLKILAPHLCATDLAHSRSLRRWWQNMGRTTAEFSVVNRLWDEERIEVRGREHLEKAHEMGGPPIFVSMHLATWEAVFVAIHTALAGPSIGPFQPEPNRFSNQVVYNLRKRRNQYLFPPGQKSAYRLRRLLTGGGAASMTIFIDEVRDHQVHLPLFGRPAPDRGNAVVAIKLANASGGPLVPVYLSRTSGARFVLTILPPLERPAPPEQAYPVPETIQRFNEIFEPIVLENIEEWYMLAEIRPGQ